ncbi:hypothetical protein QKT49_gp220 [Acanthamoeba castellanii medusavirus]|uniref:F-box domain-containing protein n=1 Tax=Acanthamoeba castellanii medusavirus J1 TaxID=3114988 RepID=A0A3T1CXI6_9VIRU|nr:hypothetical protein QKT49_gp220 [Acanthamoeba castellanii medusavirus]BBI30543.1 hypothetical protein [Acanthamoeba castellanii medusavirus J1]
MQLPDLDDELLVLALGFIRPTELRETARASKQLRRCVKKRLSSEFLDRVATDSFQRENSSIGFYEGCGNRFHFHGRLIAKFWNAYDRSCKIADIGGDGLELELSDDERIVFDKLPGPPALRYRSRSHAFGIVYNQREHLLCLQMTNVEGCVKPGCVRPLIVTHTPDGDWILWPDIKSCEHLPGDTKKCFDTVSEVLERFRDHFTSRGLLIVVK